MISDYSVPPDCQPSGTAENARRPRYLRGRWYPEELTALAGRLDGPGREALAALPDADLLEAWNSALATLLDPGSPARRALDPALNMTCRLSGPALQAALEAMLEGHTGEPASRGRRARRGARTTPTRPRRLRPPIQCAGARRADAAAGPGAAPSGAAQVLVARAPPHRRDGPPAGAPPPGARRLAGSSHLARRPCRARRRGLLGRRDDGGPTAATRRSRRSASARTIWSAVTERWQASASSQRTPTPAPRPPDWPPTSRCSSREAVCRFRRS